MGVLIKVAIAAVAIAAAATWWASMRAGLIADGRALERQAQEAANAKARAARQDSISGLVVEISQREQDTAAKLRAAESAIDLAQKTRSSNVSPAADAACRVTRGLVLDLDAALPGAAGRAAVPVASGNVDDSAGIPISRIRDAVAGNYAECSKALERLRTLEERRYAACVAWDARFRTQSQCARGSP